MYKKDDKINIEKIWNTLRLRKLNKIMCEETSALKNDPIRRIKFKHLSGIRHTNDLIDKENLPRSPFLNLDGLVIIDPSYSVIACTDLHGDIEALDNILRKTAFEEKVKQGEKVIFLVLGDMVDRGEYSFELLRKLFHLKINYPSNVVLFKADHEEHFRYDNDSFSGRISPSEFSRKFKYIPQKYAIELFFQTFISFPYIAIHDKIIYTHGGLPGNTRGVGNLIGLEYDEGYGNPLFDIYWTDLNYEINEARDSTRGGDVVEMPFSLCFKKLERMDGPTTLIRGHQNTYLKTDREGNQKPIAYDISEHIDAYRKPGKIITIHSNCSYYASPMRDGSGNAISPEEGIVYNDGSYIEVLPNEKKITVHGVRKDEKIDIELL